MLIENSFDVDADPDRVFGFLGDAHNVATCFPGAELTEDLGNDSYRGKVKVKLGPVTAAFSGTATVTERDAEGRVAVLVAEGKDARGSGTAKAKASMRVEPKEGGGARVQLQTDLTISGKLAQFGRGIMADVSTRMVGDLAKNVRERIEAEPEPAPAEAAVEPADAPATAAGEPAATPESAATAETSETAAAQPATSTTAAAPPQAPSPTQAPAPAPVAGTEPAPDNAIKASTLFKIMIAGVFRRLFARLRGRAPKE
jgi:carbon monoxide dehydrogenase subunit G